MKQLSKNLRGAYYRLDGLFTPKEAWTLYIWVAYAETIGWLLLLFGIFSTVLHWPYADWSLGVGGSVHGMIFISYLLIVFFTHRSMKWRFWHLVAAEALSNVPFGALLFEQYITRKLKH